MDNDANTYHSDDHDESKKNSASMKEKQYYQGDKTNISRSSKKFADTLIKTLTEYIDIAERVQEEYKKLSPLVTRIENFYTSESKKLDYYKMLLNKKKLTKREIDNNAYHIQEILETIDYDFSELMRILRMQIIFFPDEEDRTYYDNKIDTVSKLFSEIYQDIQDIAFEEQNLAKMI